jgi:O-antigen/teichoic acid export membrane protein
MADTDILDSPEAARRVVRGGAMRSAGYVAGLGLGLVAIPLLSRHLGVVEFGQYVVVTSLIAIVTILADAGLTTVGVREYAVRDADGRHRLMRNLVAARIAIAALGAAGAVVFAFAAGYDDVLVAGTALGGLGLLFTMAQQTYAIPLTAELRLGSATALDLARQALTVIGIVVLVLAGAELLAFFVIPVPVGIVLLAGTLLVIREHRGVRPGVDPGELRYLLPETVPAAAASVLASLFYRVAIVLMSLIATATQAGYFAASFRVVEAFVAVPSLVVGSAYPVLARVADREGGRLSIPFQRLFDVCAILGAGAAFLLVAGADFIIDVIAGPEFAPAVPVLQIHGLAIAETFFVALFSGTLWVVRRKRSLVVGHAVGLLAAIGLTLALVPGWEAEGAAVAMVVAEGLLGIWLGAALLWSLPELRPSLSVLPKVALGLLLAGLIALAPLPDVVVVALGSAAYLGVIVALRGVPVEAWQAFRRSSLL